VRPGPLATFVLFEGSVIAAIVLALADIVTGWGVLVIPVAVAVMVKLNDVVAAALRRPDAIAQLGRPRLADPVAVGISPRPRSAHLTTWIESDDAVADPSARPESPTSGPPDGPGPAPRPGRAAREGVARGIASVLRPADPPAPDQTAGSSRATAPGAVYRRSEGRNHGRFAS
jgi:hypothetical protein